MKHGKWIDPTPKNLRKYTGIPVVIKDRYGDLREDKVMEVWRKNIRLDYGDWKYFGTGIRAIFEAIGHELPEPVKKEFEVKYVLGYPTKKSLIELVELFDPNYQLYPCQQYSGKHGWKKFNWQLQSTQDRIHEFIDWASENHGIEFGEMRDYKSPSTGMLQINKKEK